LGCELKKKTRILLQKKYVSRHIPKGIPCYKIQITKQPRFILHYICTSERKWAI